MIVGKKVKLTTIERSDLSQLLKWRNREDYRKYFREYREISVEMQNQWFENQVNSNQSTIMFAIRNADTEELIGCCGLCYINWIHRHADLSLYIGWENKYIDDEGYAEESCELLFKYAFEELNLNKVWTEIYEFDIKKKELYDDLGLQVDGVLRENYFHDGKWWNSNIMSILHKQFIKQL